MDQKEYLKKYLAKSEGKKKKKKTKVTPRSNHSRSKIIDDDIDVRTIIPIDEADIDILDVNDDAPQIVGYTDDRPDDIRLMAEIRETNKWRVITNNYDDVEVSEKLPRAKIKKEPTSDGDLSPPRRRKSNDSDASPPRKNQKNLDSDSSPPRRPNKNTSNKKNYDSDASPPRKNQKNLDSDSSPPRRPNKNTSNKKNYDSDASPPRKNQKNLDSDSSPPRRPNKNTSNKKNYDSDASPPRKRKETSQKSGRSEKHLDSDESPPRKNKNRSRKNSDSDVSPPRKNSSPPRHRRNSPSRRYNNQRQDFNRRDNYFNRNSGHQRRDRYDRGYDSGYHRSRNGNRRHSPSPSRKRNRESPINSQKPRENKTLEGKKAGLSDAKELRKEVEEIRKRDADNLAKLSDDVSGRGAATIVRDKYTGSIRDLKDEARKKHAEDEKKSELISQYAVWGKGQKQIDDRVAQREDEEHEMSKPLARYANDQDLEEMLKREERDGDPMLDYIRKKRKKEVGEQITKKTRPEYEGSYAPNRYNIKPGYRWDGVDRSTGFEKKWFEEQNDRKAREDEYNKWSVMDM